MGSSLGTWAHVGGDSGSEAGLPSIHTHAAAKAQAQVDRQTDNQTNHRRRRGGRAGDRRDLEADAVSGGKPGEARTHLQDVSRKEMFTSQWVWTLHGKKQTVGVASRTGHLERGLCVRLAPQLPQSTSPEGTALAQTRFQHHLVPGQPPAAATRKGPGAAGSSWPHQRSQGAQR